MPVSTTAPCPIKGCGGQVDVEVKLKLELPAPGPGTKPGGQFFITSDGVTLTGDHMRDHHPDVKIPASLRGQ